MEWITDRLRVGPGLLVKNGVLDVNQFDPRRTDPSLTLPSAHAYTHADGGSDEVTLTQSQIVGLVDALAAIDTILDGLDATIAAAIAEIIPPWDESNIGQSLTVLSDLALGWADAGATVPLMYDSALDYDDSHDYDDGMF